jgi:hypothetical protein
MGCGKHMPQATFLYTLKYPMRFSVSIPSCLGPSTYSTFGILRFTVLSRLGRGESYQAVMESVNSEKNWAARQIFVGLTVLAMVISGRLLEWGRIVNAKEI